MAVPVTITDLTTTVASNSPQGSDAIGTNADDYIRALSAILKESGATLYTATGTDTITFSTTPTFSAYASGQRFFVKAAAANTGAVTVNINALGAKNVLKSGATALSAGDIPAANAHFLIEYDGTQFQLLNPVYALFGAGTVSLPAITLNGDTDSGLYQIGANNYGVAMNGAKVLDIASTGLSVTGAIVSTSAALHALSPLGAQAATRLYLSSADQTSATNGLIVGDSGGNTALQVRGDRSVVLGASIATVSSTGLAVTGTVTATRSIQAASATTGVSVFKGTNDPAAVASGGTLVYDLGTNVRAIGILQNTTDGPAALYFFSSSATEISDPDGGFSTTNTGVIRCTYSGGVVTLTNDYGATKALLATFLALG